MTEIKGWPQFQGMMPYGRCGVINDVDYKVEPLTTPCAIHANGYDCFDWKCECAELKLVRRSKEEIAEIHALQEQSRRESILRQADEIRKLGTLPIADQRA
jgi:hypothetical protein